MVVLLTFGHFLFVHKPFIPSDTIDIAFLGESRKKRAKQCVDNVFKLFFENLKNHHGNTTCQKKCFIFEINSYTFKVTTTKFS
jgi:hypothetical protein